MDSEKTHPLPQTIVRVERIHFMPDGRPAPAFLTAEDVILFLRGAVSINTIQRATSSGKLIAGKPGKAYIYPVEEVIRWASRGAKR